MDLQPASPLEDLAARGRLAAALLLALLLLVMLMVAAADRSVGRGPASPAGSVASEAAPNGSG